jgi:hypothetical protein
MEIPTARNFGSRIALACNFAFSEIVSSSGFGRTLALAPQKLRIEISVPPLETIIASIK